MLPSPRNQAAMAYDAYHQQVVLFGGYAVARGLTDTWIWNGATWAPVTSQPTFSGTALESRLVYDAAQRELLLFLVTGGKFSWATSIWVWGGTGWIRRT